ncbi:hypothetical protein [Arsenicitalea aurantiaca]|uniref:hypothetical protein n=1 Tax=Arsenicitalea aurantiaca TaxID=1783274 RepID=UPI001865250D|nr:hypothetical protein [Arsenicitalea aurantiaca]
MTPGTRTHAPSYDGSRENRPLESGRPAALRREQQAAHALPALIVATLWLGMLIGVSFLATPIKFAAPTLSLPVALDVGRVTFGLFSKVEWAMAVVLIAAVFLTRATLAIRVAAIVTITVVAGQAIWLLPILDARIEAVIAGSPQPPSHHHTAYVVMEAVKVIGLLVSGLAASLALSPLHSQPEGIAGGAK